MSFGNFLAKMANKAIDVALNGTPESNELVARKRALYATMDDEDLERYVRINIDSMSVAEKAATAKELRDRGMPNPLSG